jgi:hypothetical protein
MPTKQTALRVLDSDYPYRLSEADDTALYRLRGLLSLLGDLSGAGIKKPSATIDIESLHATCWLMLELVDDIIGRYNLDYHNRKAA